jgi:hypothetical protein
MDVFKIETDYDSTGNSPWNALWYEGKAHDLQALQRPARLEHVWKTPVVTLETRDRAPDVFEFMSYWAVPDPVRELLAPLVSSTVEFLPLSIAKGPALFVLHPLIARSLDERAIVESNPVSHNITNIRRYSFGQSEEAAPMFTVRQPLGSWAGDGGYVCSDVLVSRPVKELCASLTGIRFRPVVSSPIMSSANPDWIRVQGTPESTRQSLLQRTGGFPRKLVPTEHRVFVYKLDNRTHGVCFEPRVPLYWTIDFLSWLSDGRMSAGVASAVGWITSPGTGVRYFLSRVPGQPTDTIHGLSAGGMPIEINIPTMAARPSYVLLDAMPEPLLQRKPDQLILDFKVSIDSDPRLLDDIREV